jgi:flagellar FliL protein
MKYIGILFMAIILAGVGGTGGYFFFQKQAVASLGEEKAGAIEAKMKRDKAARLSEEEVKNLRFVELEPIILPIIDADGVSQVVTLIVSLEVLGEKNVEYVQRLKPRLKDAYIQDMYGVLNRKATLDGGGMIKVDQLKNRLSNLSQEVLGAKKVNGVLLQVVNQRAI